MIIFIGGVGRSGTHMVGRLLATHKRIDVRLESGVSFDSLAKLASNPYISSLERLLRKSIILFDLFRYYLKRGWVVEKTHSSLWSADFLFKFYPKSKMIIVERDVFSVLASMKVHKGVNTWYDILPQNRINPFLGIDRENVDIFERSDVLYKYFVKWKSHIDRGRELKHKYPDNILIVDYEGVVLKHQETIEAICSFLNLEIADLNYADLSDKSLNKWEGVFSKEDIIFIKKIINEGKNIR